MNRAVWFAVVALVGLVGGLARADLFATGSNTIYQYTDAGQRFRSIGGSEEFNSAVRGPDGRIYAVSNILGGGTIIRIDPASGQVEEVAGPGTPAAGYTMPLGLAFGPDGSLYGGSNQFVPQFGTSGVMKYNPATRKMDPFVYVGNTNDLITDIGFGPDGDLYVAVGNSGIFRVDGDTGDTITLVRTHSDQYFYGYGGSRMTFGPDGMMYLSDSMGHIHRVDIVNNLDFGIFVPASAGGDHTVNGMAFGADGSFYVASGHTGEILRYDGQTGAFLNVLTSDPGSIRPQRWDIAHVPEPASGVAVTSLAAVALLGRGRREKSHS